MKIERAANIIATIYSTVGTRLVILGVLELAND